MNFGKYLIDNNVIEKEVFIQAAVKQSQSQPSVLVSLVELGICDSDKVLEVIFLSLDSGNDILSCMKELAISEADLAKVVQFQKDKSLNLIDSLVNDGLADKDKVIELYKSFQEEGNKENVSELTQPESTNDSSSKTEISAAALESLKELQGGDIDMSQFDVVEETPIVEEVSAVEKPTQKTKISAAALESLKELQGGEIDMSEFEIEDEQEVEVKVETKTDESEESEVAGAEPEISAAALESLREMGGVPDSDLEALSKVAQGPTSDEKELDPSSADYISIYNEQKNKKMKKILQMIKSAAESDSDIANYFNSLFRELHVVKGAAVLVEAKYSKKLIEIWELIIDKIFTMSNPELKAWFYSYEQCLHDTIGLLWEIRESVAKSTSEEEYMQVEESRNKYLITIGTLKKIIAEIS